MSGGNDATTGEGATLLRRVSLKSTCWKPEQNRLESAAFLANARDSDGISLFRSSAATPQDVAWLGFIGNDYFVVEISEEAFVARGLTVADTPGPIPGHVSISELNSSNVKDAASSEHRHALAKQFLRVHGPYQGRTPKPPRP